ncbi:Autotransporter beta-domain-containing protein [Pseudomonas antarctica]|uniref:Autotransporter beta-domain-containing protein n=1 Tax=Pseudomonas antarctica TaxID=219572 RepID=A0A1H0D8G4_9PSED|nr:autotransporter domain-containing protein [Pseudomonas antarctica]KAF2405665.1 extracellular serine protease precursor [Pseudomonas antarctica]SDN66266.1 Autotransporter beta-domain-containing protein [Pseudomonas antarctica]
MSPIKSARSAEKRASIQASFKRNAIALCVLGGLSGMPVEAANYVEQGRLHDAASWRSDEFKRNWGLGAVGADYAYARGLSGAGVRLGVYDSGTDLRHSEFAGKPNVGVLMADTGCMSGTVLERGCFYTEGDRAAVTVIDSLPPEALTALEDAIADGILTREQLDEYLGFVGATYNAHGTHVAGTALANRDGSGIQGVAYAANLSAVRKYGNTYLGGPISITDILRPPLPTVAAVDAAYAQLHRQNVRVVNNSWGSPFSPANDTELDMALSETGTSVYSELKAIADNAITYGMLQVWSAGNVTTANESPQKAPNAGLHPSLPRAIAALEPYWLTVVNLNKELTLGEYSKRCGFSKDWCLAAPGTDINSSWVTGSIQTENHFDQDGGVNGFAVTGDKPELGYMLSSGSSMSAPHVSGGLALLMERFPYLDNPQIRDVLLTTATDLGEPGVDDVYGWGLMNLKKAIDGPGQLRVDTNVNMGRPAGGAIVWQGGAWDDWRNDISGPGRLEKTGIGWLRLSGNNSFAGATLKEGILELDGINTLKGDVNVDGGALRVNGSLAVVGDYKQAAGSTLMTGLVDPSAPAKLQVQNQASINGGSLYLSAQPNSYYLGQRYSILQAQGALTGEFASIDRREFSPFLSVSQVKEGNVLRVEFGRGRSLASAAGTANQRAVANAADAETRPSPVLQRLTALFPDQAPSALDPLSGELHASTQAVLIENSRVLRQAALDRQRSAQDSRATALDARNQGVWVQLPRQSGQLAGDSNTTRTAHSSTGLLVGFDHTLEQGTRLGVVVGGGQTEVKAGARGKASVDTYQVGLHVGHTWDAFGLYGGIAYAQHKIQTKRRVSFPGLENSLSAQYASRTVQTFAEANYKFSHDVWDWQPYLQLANVQQRSEGFNERGGIAALKGKRSKENVNLTTGGVRVNIDLGKAQVGPSWLSLHGGLAYTHASGDLQPTTQAAWDGGRVMSVSGAPLDRLSTRLELGATARLTRDSALDVGFTRQHGERTRDQSITAQYSLQF